MKVKECNGRRERRVKYFCTAVVYKERGMRHGIGTRSDCEVDKKRERIEIAYFVMSPFHFLNPAHSSSRFVTNQLPVIKGVVDGRTRIITL